MSRYVDIKGKKFNRLTALEYLYTDKNRNAVWRWQCDCGKEIDRVASPIRRNIVKSCGCLNKELAGKLKYWEGKHRESMMGSNNPMWKDGGTTRFHYFKLEYKMWRKAVFKRDDWTCQECGKRGGRLQVHHIKEQSNYPELIYDMDNGVTLCQECHRKTDNYGFKAIKTNKQAYGLLA